MDADHHAGRLGSFRVAPDGALVRAVVPRRGDPYEHRCQMGTLVAIAHRFDETDRGETVESLAEAEDVPVTQVATALAFLLERGMVERAGRRSHAASGCVHLDAMTEYHALREKGVPG